MRGHLKAVLMPIMLVALLLFAIPSADGAHSDLLNIHLYDAADPDSEYIGGLIPPVDVPIDTYVQSDGTTLYYFPQNVILSDCLAFLKIVGPHDGYRLDVSINDISSLMDTVYSDVGLTVALFEDQGCTALIATADLGPGKDDPSAYRSSFGSQIPNSVPCYIRIYTSNNAPYVYTDTVPSGSGSSFTLSFSVSVDDEMTVTFDPNGGSVSSTSKVVSYGDSYGDLPSSYRSGYSFQGWYTSATGGDLVKSDTIVTMTDDHTLYAHWSYIPVPTPDPKPEPPTPPEPEHSESESIGEDGSKTETEKETTVDGDRTTVIEKETNTKTDGSSIVTESKTVTESTETGSESITESTSTSKDSLGNILSVTETTTKVTVDGDNITKIIDSVVRDPDGNIISEDRSESIEVSKGEGVKESSSSVTTVTSEGTVTKETVSQITDNDGTIITSSVTSEVHRDNDGNTIKTVATESQSEGMIVSGGKVTKVDSTVVTKDADGNILTSDKVTEERSITVSGKETTTSFNTVTESRDADGNLIGITESISETKQSPGSEIVTDFTERFTASDGQVKVVEGVSSTAGDYSITTVAVTITEHGDSSSNAKTTLNYLGTAILDAPDVDLAYGHSVKTTSSMGMDDVERNVRVTSGNGVSAVATGAAFGKMSSLGMGLYIEGSVGSLRYDPDACGSFASSGKDVTITMLKDVVDVLTEAQKEVVGKTGFVSVSAYAGAEYVTELGGTVTISFTFDMGQGSFAAFYVADDGSTEQVPFTYDSRSGTVSMFSGHHSVYAMLPVEEPVPADRNESGLWVAGIIIVLAAVILAVIVVRRRS